MLGLKLETDPRWIDVASENIEQILIDHAFCEQKAASNAISIIVQFPQYTDLVKDMTAICIEEMEHFGMVHEKLIERGLKLGFERKDHYVNDILKFLKKKWSEYLKENNQLPSQVDPDDFAQYGFKALIKHRLPLYEEIANKWGVIIDASSLSNIKNTAEFNKLIEIAIDNK